MNVEASGEQLTEWEIDLRNVLIDEAGLSAEAVECIIQTAGATRLGFADAALDLGLVTREQVESAIERIRTGRTTRTSNAVTVSLQRPDPERALPLRIGTAVSPGPALLEALDPYSQRGEIIRALRTELLLNGQTADPNGLLALLSPNAGEGRSQLCAELALSFAQLGRRTLLVDADLRSPSQHKLFGSTNEWGVAQAIAFGDAAHAQPVEGVRDLSLLVAGATMPNPLEMLTNPNFHRLVALWRAEYEFVIFDTPPISRFADGLLIAKLTGRVLLISRANETTQFAIKDTVRRLAGTQAQIVGSVINRF